MVPGGLDVIASASNAGDPGLISGDRNGEDEDPLEKEMATHSSVLAWKIPWTEKPGRLQSMGSQSWTQLSDFAFTFHFHGSFRQGDKNAAFLSSAFKTVIWDYNGFLWLL